MKHGIEHLPTATVTPVRLCAFQATRRPKQLVKTINTVFGSITIDGRLGQAHSDLMECVMFHAERSRIENGRLEVIIDPYRIRMAMGGGESKYSSEQLDLLSKDLTKAMLETDTPTVNIKGHIVEKIVEAKIKKTDRRAWTAECDRNLVCWVFSQEWTTLIQADIARYYDPAALCRIDHGSVAAIARHVLTHQHQPNGGWKLDGLIEAAGVERQHSKVKQEVQNNAEVLAELGIRISGDRVFLAAPAPSLAASAPFIPGFSRTRPIF